MIRAKFKLGNGVGYILLEEPKIGEDGYYRYIYRLDFPNDKYYIGKRVTQNLDDGYAGSGSLLPRY